ncbi:MAG: cadherin-like beta sandwich domain-containing protein [Bacillota bacterium]
MGIKSKIFYTVFCLLAALIVLGGTAYAEDVVWNNTYQLSGDVVVEGNLRLAGGALDLNGYTLTVRGDLYHTDGTVYINKGTLIVEGDYRIGDATKNPLEHSLGYLHMLHNEDKVLVYGAFMMVSRRDHKNFLINGVLEVRGNFIQKHTWGTIDATNFATSGGHMLILSGLEAQSVSFMTPSYSNFNILEINNSSSSGVIFSDKARVTGHVYFTSTNVQHIDRLQPVGTATVEGGVWPGNLHIYNGSAWAWNLQQDLIVDGYVSLTEGSSFDLNGYNLTALAVGLDGLEIKDSNGDEFTLDFEKNTLSYSINVPYATSSITIVPTANDGVISFYRGQVGSGNTVEIYDDEISINNLSVGENCFYIVVTEDQYNSKTYKIIVNRANPQLGNNIIEFSLPGQTLPAVIDNETRTVCVEVYYGADITSMAAEFVLSPGASACVSGIKQVSGQTKNDFSNPVTYVITAENDFSAEWTVTVTVAPQEVSAGLLSLELSHGSLSPGFDQDVTAYTVQVPYSELPIRLTPTAAAGELSATVTVNANGNLLEGEEGFFEIPLVVGENEIEISVNEAGKAPKVYNLVIIMDAAQEGNDIIEFSLPGQTSPAAINSSTRTVCVEVYYGADITSMAAEFVLSPGASASVDGIEQVSGETQNDFSTPVAYLITAEDGSTVEWIISVTVAPQEVSAGLQSLVLSHGALSPDFDQDVSTYTVQVAYSVSSIQLTPTAVDGEITITANGSPLKCEQGSFITALKVGENEIKIVVIEEGKLPKLYDIIITRASASRKSPKSHTLEELPGDNIYPILGVDNDNTNHKTLIVMDLKSNVITVDEEELEVEVFPFLKPGTNRLLVPIRFIGEVLGFSVFWKEDLQQVHVSSSSNSMILTVGSQTVLNGNEIFIIDCPPEIIDSRMFVPLRFVSEAMGADVYWDASAKTVTIIQQNKYHDSLSLNKD